MSCPGCTWVDVLSPHTTHARAHTRLTHAGNVADAVRSLVTEWAAYYPSDFASAEAAEAFAALQAVLGGSRLAAPAAEGEAVVVGWPGANLDIVDEGHVFWADPVYDPAIAEHTTVSQVFSKSGKMGRV